MSGAAQLALDLPPPRRWGGRRAGAGRKPSPRSGVPHLRRAVASAHTPGHVTLRIRPGLPSLRQPRLVAALERALRAACERGWFRVVQYSVQRDHVHLIVEADGPAALARGMMSIGARIARALNRVLRRRGAVLADRYHLRLLKTPREVRNVLAYVLNNFRKHEAARRSDRRAAGSAIDPASSGRWFTGWTDSTRAAAPSAGPAAVAPARTWLLRVGWWRHGRIDPAEIPGMRPRR